MSASNRFDRRYFLRGLGGAALALPMLEAFLPRAAAAQTVGPPKRLLIIYHQDGRLMGDGRTSNGKRNDWWSPAAAGALPVGAAPSQMLAPLQAVRDELVTIDGVDNVVRHLYPDQDNHMPAQKALLTCRGPGANDKPAAPSFDYVMGQRLRAPGSTGPASVVMFGTAADYTWRANGLEVFWGAGGTPPWLIDPDPKKAIAELFGPPVSSPSTPRPTLTQRLSQQRKSVLDGVLDNFRSLRGRVNAADKARLDAHADFVRALEQSAAPSDGGTGTASASCQRPSEASVPSNTDASGSAYLRGERDAQMMPAIVENVVQAFACDTARVASLMFWQADDPVFPTEFSGTSPFANDNWHGVIHGVPRIYEDATSQTHAQHLSASYGLYAKTFTSVVQRLASFTEPDGSRLLDNTLVLWVSEMGYGSVHTTYNLPVVLAGLGAAFPKGQGRHVVENRRTMGDLLAHVMRLFGGADTTFGATGTLGSNGGVHAAEMGWGSSIDANTPLHHGPLDL